MSTAVVRYDDLHPTAGDPAAQVPAGSASGIVADAHSPTGLNPLQAGEPDET